MARKLMTHDTPQLNSVTERLNCTLLEQMHALTHMSGLPKSLWGEALRQATWLKNRTAMRALDGKMPFEALFGCPPDLSTLQTWGTPVLVHNATGSKLDTRARNAHCLRPDADTKAHHVYWPSISTVTVEHNVYSRTSAQLEGEEENLLASDSEQAAAPHSSTNSPPIDPPRTPTVEDAIADDKMELQEEQPAKPPPPPLRHSQRLRRPSHVI